MQSFTFMLLSPPRLATCQIQTLGTRAQGTNMIGGTVYNNYTFYNITKSSTD